MDWTYGTITVDGTTRDAVQDPDDGTVYRLHDGEVAQTPVTRAAAATFATHTERAEDEQRDREDDAATERLRVALVAAHERGVNARLGGFAVAELLGYAFTAAIPADDFRASAIVANAGIYAFGDPDVPGHVPGTYAAFMRGRNAADDVRP